jgi:hypothetical protein
LNDLCIRPEYTEDASKTPHTNRCLNTPSKFEYSYILFRNTLVGAALAAAGFFVAVAPIPLIVPITVFFTGDLVGAVLLVTTVVPELVSVDWLLLLALPFPGFAFATWGAFWHQPLSLLKMKQ